MLNFSGGQSQASCSWVVLKGWAAWWNMLGNELDWWLPGFSLFDLSPALFTQLCSWHLHLAHLTKGQGHATKGGELFIKAFRSHANGKILRAHEMIETTKCAARKPLVCSCDPKPVQWEGRAGEGWSSHFSLGRALVSHESRYLLNFSS